MLKIKANNDISNNITGKIWTVSNNNLLYNTGNVGIGTNNPVNTLHINGSCGIGTTFSTLSIQNNSLVISGNLGIGTTITPQKVSIYGGNATITSGNASLYIYNDRANGLGLFINGSTSVTEGGANTSTLRNDGGALRLQAAGGNGITILANGNVGIGTSNPEAPLHVNGNIMCSGQILQIQTIQYTDMITYSSPTGNVATSIAVLNIAITPKKSNSKIVLQWMVSGEIDNNNVFVVLKNGSQVGYNTSSGNVYYSGTVCAVYDNDTGSTPNTYYITWTDSNVGSTTTQTYSIGVKSSVNATSFTFYLNRPAGNTGGENYETMISNGVAFEIAV